MKRKFHSSCAVVLGCLAVSQVSSSGQQPNYIQPHEASTDGVPTSSTAVSSTQLLTQGGFAASRSKDERQAAPGTEDNSRGSFDLTPDFGSFSTTGVKGDSYTLPLFANYKLTDRVGLNINLPVQYTEFRTAFGNLDVWDLTLNLGVPVKVIKRSKEQPLSWTVTPHGGLSGDIADDAGDSHTLIGQGGVTSLLSYETEYFTVSLGNQITCYETLSKSGSYKFSADVDQQVLKNGLKLSIPFGHRWVLDVYGIHTEFLQKYFLDRYYTIGGAVGYHLSSMKKNGYLKAGIYADLGEHYRAAHLQFGTAWKF